MYVQHSVLAQGKPSLLTTLQALKVTGLKKKKRLRQRAQKLRASKKMGTIFQKYFVQKPAKPATDLSHNGHQKIHLVQKPFRLLFPATISLKSF